MNTLTESSSRRAASDTDYAVIGSILSERYLVQAVVGQGSFGRVFQAQDQETGETVALKEFVRTRGRSDSFLRELGLLFDLRHPHILSCRTLVLSGLYRYLVCEYMEGGSLRGALESAWARPSRLLKLLSPVCDAVQYAHDRGVIHRDLKPENLLLSAPGDHCVLKVSDLGIATFSASSPDTLSFIGSPAYMAPEQFYERYDHRIDVYALGVIAYEIICGRRPFSGSPAQLMNDHIRLEPEWPAWVPRIFVRVLKRALAKKPDKRFDSVAAFREALDVAVQMAGDEIDSSLRWPVTVGPVLSLAQTSSEVFALGPEGCHRFDFGGRLLGVDKGVTELTCFGDVVLQRRGDTAVVSGLGRPRAHRGIPKEAACAVSCTGEIAYIDEGRLVVRNERNVATLPDVPGPVTAVAFVGAAGILATAAGTPEGASFVSFGGRRVALPEPVDAIHGHPRRVELLCRSKSEPSRYFMVKDDAKPVRLSAQRFVCDEESFYGVGDDGDLLMINVGAGRVARTRLGVALSAVTAGRDRMVLADRHGQLFVWK